MEPRTEPFNYYPKVRRSKWIARYAILVPLLATLNIVIWHFFSDYLHRQTEINRDSNTVFVLRICARPLFPVQAALALLLPRSGLELIPYTLWLVASAAIWGACIVGLWQVASIVRATRNQSSYPG